MIIAKPIYFTAIFCKKEIHDHLCKFFKRTFRNPSVEWLWWTGHFHMLSEKKNNTKCIWMISPSSYSWKLVKVNLLTTISIVGRSHINISNVAKNHYLAGHDTSPRPSSMQNSSIPVSSRNETIPIQSYMNETEKT